MNTKTITGIITIIIILIGWISWYLTKNKSIQENTINSNQTIQMATTNTGVNTSEITSQIQQEKHTNSIKKPVVTISTDFSGCKYEVRINDVPIVSDKHGLQIKAAQSVNQWVRNGENKLYVHISPVPGSSIEEMEATVTVLVEPLEGNTSSETTVLKWHYDGKETKHQQSVGEAITNQQEFQLSLPFPEWKWFTSDVISSDENTRKDLFNEYQKILNALKNRNVEYILPDFRERFTELAASTFKSADVMAKSYGLAAATKNQQLELSPIDPNDSPLVVFGDGHLAKITYWDGSPLIGMNFKDGSGSVAYDIIFRREKGKWIITR